MTWFRMLLPISLLAVCSWARDLCYNFAPGANFSKFKTYKWVDIKGAEKINQMV
jgi:hypothetical protein